MARPVLQADNSGKLDITCRRGDSLKLKFEFTVKDSEGEEVPIDLTDNVFTLYIYGLDSFAIVIQVGTIVDNAVFISRTPAQMSQLKGVFAYEVKRNFGNSTVKAIISGKLNCL